MIRHVADDDPGQRADGEDDVGSDAAARERVGRQAREERDRCGPDGRPLLDETRQLAVVPPRRKVPDVLVVRRQRVTVASREGDRPKREDAFGVDEMPDELLDGPLAGRVGVSGLRGRQAAETALEGHLLGAKGIDDGTRGHLRDVAFVVRCVFVGVRTRRQASASHALVSDALRLRTGRQLYGRRQGALPSGCPCHGAVAIPRPRPHRAGGETSSLR